MLQITHHTFPCIGGIEKYVLEISEKLNQHGFETEVLCLNRCPNSKKKLPEKEIISGVQVTRIPFIDLKYYKIAPSVIKFIKNFDVLHIHGLGFFSDFLVLTKPFHKKPVIISTHGGFFHTKSIGIIKKFYFHTINRLVIGFADSVLAGSKNDEQIFKKITSRNLRMIELGVNLDEYSSLESNSKKNRLLYIGRFSKNKGLENLVKTFSIVIKTKPDALLTIIGEDFDGTKKVIENLVQELGISKNVVFLGNVSHKKKLEEISKSMFCISASEYEGFGLAVVEQMSAGNIPILNDIPNFRRFISEHKSGIITDFSDIQKAAKKITGIMSLSLKTLRNFSKTAKKDAKRFDFKNYVSQIQKVYKEV